MYLNRNRNQTRKPEERVGTLSHASLPPPESRVVDLEEHLWVRALRDRDEAAFDRLVDRYYSAMLRLARSFVRSREEAEEVVQDTWLGVLSGLEKFEGRSSLKTWIFRILVNRARTRARREARSIPLSAIRSGDPERIGSAEEHAGTGCLDRLALTRPATDAAWGLGSPSPDPESLLLDHEMRGRIDAAIEALPGRQREVITLRDLEGYPAAEVCEILDLTEVNQRVLLHRARMRVREALLPYLTGAGGPSVGSPPKRGRVAT